MNKIQRFKKGLYCPLFLFFLIGSVTVSCKDGGQQKNAGSGIAEKLLPAPQEVEFKRGINVSTEKLKTIYLFSGAGDSALFTANLLKDEIKQLFGYSPELQVVQSYDGLNLPAIILGIPNEDQGFSKFCSGLPLPKEDNKESYILDVKEGLITISGGGDAGLFYGVQTFVQILEEAKWAHKPLQGMLINDWPEMKLRWVHYNYFYHLDRFEYIKESIRNLARYKVNGIVFEFEDKFKYQSHPFIVAPNSLTAEQVNELTLYARSYHIEIIPLVQGFGHAGYLLKHDELKHLRENPEVNKAFCPLNEGTYDLIFDMYRETIEATPGVKYFHIGGDEVPQVGICPLCREKEKEVGELGLYLTWLNRVHRFMEEHGRTVVFWDDMPLKQAGVYRLTKEEIDLKMSDGLARLDNVIDKFPQDAVFMRWDYNFPTREINAGILDWYNESGFENMVATAVIGNWPLIPDYKLMPANIESLITMGTEKKSSGVLCTAWGDDAGNHFEIYWLGFLATSEYAWSRKGSQTLDQYWEKYIRRFFGPNTDGLISAFHNLSESVFFWNEALVEEGKKHTRGYKLKQLPALQNQSPAGSWGQHFKNLMDTARLEKVKCAEALKVLEQNMDKVIRNKYNLEVFASMGQFMEAHCDFVLSIGEIANFCDNAVDALNKGKKEEVVANLNKMATVADSAWEKYVASYESLKSIWEVARLPKGGEGYILNPQTSYMAGWTADLSYLIFAEKNLDLPGYANKLRQMAVQYQEKGTLSFNE